MTNGNTAGETKIQYCTDIFVVYRQWFKLGKKLQGNGLILANTFWLYVELPSHRSLSRELDSTEEVSYYSSYILI